MKLYDYRKAKGYTLNRVANITGISKSTLWRIENKLSYKITLRDALVLVNHFPQIGLEDLNHANYPSMQNMLDTPEV